MLRNSNTIALQPANSRYEEYMLDPAETGLAMPGTVLALGRSSDDVFAGNAVVDGVYQANGNNAVTRSETPHGMGRGMLTSQADTNGAAPLGLISPFLVIENALLGTALNKPSIPGSVIPGYRVSDEDVFNVRCVPGSYTVGQPVFLIQTINGIYVTNEYEAGLPLFGHAEENYVVTAANTDLVDNSTHEIPPLPQTAGGVTYLNLNGALVNLLRVRIKFIPAYPAAPAPPTPPTP